MKKIFTFSLLTFALVLLAPISSSAASAKDIDTPRELHVELKVNGLLELNENGLLEISENLSSLGYNQDLIEEYQRHLDSINAKLSEDIIEINSDLEIAPIDAQEVADKVYQQDKEKGPMVSTMSTYLNVVHLVETNREELEDEYETMLTVAPSSAYTYSVGWWVGKVQEGGSWDYKVVSGFSPWYKTFTMGLYTSTETHNSKWLGNYNYGYTGEFLFSESILLAAGDIVSYATLNWEPDSQTAKNAIRKGHDNAVTYD